MWFVQLTLLPLLIQLMLRKELENKLIEMTFSCLFLLSYNTYLKGHTVNKIWKDEYIPLGDTRYVFRNISIEMPFFAVC